MTHENGFDFDDNHIEVDDPVPLASGSGPREGENGSPDISG